jgi:hypothetical protein
MTSLQGLSRAGLAAGAVNLVCGLLITVFSSAHLVAVTLRRIQFKIPAWVTGETHAMIAGVPYDFRIYSLVLFGAVTLSAGMVIIRSSLGVGRGEAGARRQAVWAMLIVLATVIPVIPIQDEAPLLIVPAATGLSALMLCRLSKAVPISGI